MTLGRPRKLRPEDTSVTASPEMQGEITTTFTDANAPKKVALKNELLPYLGKNSLEPNIPRYFVNGRKLIQIVKLKRSEDENGNAIYTIKRRLARTIFKEKKEGQRLLATLAKYNIPGV